mgnify:CR=1 FL=1
MKKDRIVSVDIFRGATILLMVLVNTPGTWSNVYGPFLHADWHGYTPTDLVFPFFLFIVGTSIAFSYKNRTVDAKAYKKIAIRALKLIALGLFLGAFLIWVTAVLLIGYWLLMTFVPVEGVASTLERAPNNLANWIDVKVFGTHNYKADYDPEGLLSTVPAIASSLLGVFTGLILTAKQEKKATILMGIGGSFLIIGHMWDLVFPINKALWTSSFVLVTAGWANLILALIYYLTDVKKIEFGSIFRYAGANAIVIYFLSSFISKVMGQIQVGDTSLHVWLFQKVYVHDFLALETSSLLYGLSVVLFYSLVGYILYQKKIFIKV